MMKRIFFLLSIFLVLNSCNVDDGERYHFQILGVEEAIVPDSFELGNTYEIKLRYYRPTTCHIYDGLYYDKDLNTRIIAIRTVVFERDNCVPADSELVEATFNFHVTNNGSYIFKFWQGTDENGEDIFYEVEVPVI
ncbi:hypothetical protein [Flavobacterium sp. J27]|uniref:hypothetical protein n=1 Tax=Flavobacterium sp. J27 TaxID=2060419 RepID=UPI001031988B|nr:hypothetical protein [Flavobacterium sp. J27]